MISGLRCTAIAVLCVSLTGCLFSPKNKPQPVQPPPLPLPVELKPPPPKVEPLPVPPPKIDASKPPEVPSAVASVPKPPAPKPKKKPKKAPIQAPPGTAAAATAAAAASQSGSGPATAPATVPGETPVPAPPTVSVPKLGEILTDEQKRQNQTICDESLNRARGALALLKGYTLTPDQKQTQTRVVSFIRQAQAARDKDPLTARQMAERADVLSRDLVKSIR